MGPCNRKCSNCLCDGLCDIQDEMEESDGWEEHGPSSDESDDVCE